jgi:hypothetical protein
VPDDQLGGDVAVALALGRQLAPAAHLDRRVDYGEGDRDGGERFVAGDGNECGVVRRLRPH